MRRPHAHAYTILAVSGAHDEPGVCDWAYAVLGHTRVRLISVEQALGGEGDVQAAAARALDDVSPADDALASAWYRRQTLPVLVTRVLNDLR